MGGRATRHASVLLTLAAMLVPCVGLGQTGGSAVPLGWFAPAHPQRASALQSLATEVWRRTSVEATAVPKGIQAVALAYAYPLIFWSLSSELPELKSDDVVQMASWLRTGGTLVVDWGGSASHLEQARTGLDTLVATLVPGGHVERIPRASVLYRSFYRLRYAAGRTRIVEDLFGVLIDGRYAIIISYNDILSALDRNSDGEFRLEVVPGGEDQREEAIRLAVNIVLYAICQDYKDDKVHMDYLKSRRNWRLPGEDSN